MEHPSPPDHAALPTDATDSPDSPPVPPTLRERLRRDTRAAHEALDAHFDGMLADGRLDRYRTFLAMNLAAYAAIEPVLASSELATLGWAAGDRLDALRRDGQALGLPEPAPVPLAWETVGLPEAFGLAYVLEGSRLGAKFMLKAIGSQPGIGARNDLPAHYLTASSDPGPFRDLLSWMSDTASSPERDARTVEAANRTFRHFHDLALLYDR